MPERETFDDRLLGGEWRVHVDAIAEARPGMELLPGEFAIARRLEARAEWETYAAAIAVEVVDARRGASRLQSGRHGRRVSPAR